MKFRSGPLLENPDFLPDEQWQPLDEPGPKTFAWIALPVGLFSGVAFCILWFGLTDLTRIDFLYWLFYKMSFIRLVLLFVALIIIHELIHVVFHLGYGLSSKSILGVWLSRGAFYASWDDEWSRNRAIACILTPFLLLTVLPFLVSLLPYANGNTMPLFCYISITNAFFACADLMGARLFFLQIPPNGILRNKGFYTYWRIENKAV